MASENVKNVIKLCRPDEEMLQVYFNGRHISTVTHDGVGWDGMEAVEDAVINLAASAEFELVEEGF